MGPHAWSRCSDAHPDKAKNARYRALWVAKAAGLPPPETVKRAARGERMLTAHLDPAVSVTLPASVLMPAMATDGGPGTELKSLLALLGFGEAGSCGCGDKARQMDRWGVAGCREHRDEIVAWLTEQQGKQGWKAQVLAGVRAAQAGLWLNPLDPAGSLLDEAIRRAEAKA